MIASADVGSSVVVNCVKGVATMVAAAAIAARERPPSGVGGGAVAIIGVTGDGVVVVVGGSGGNGVDIGVESRWNRLAMTCAGGTAIGMW